MGFSDWVKGVFSKEETESTYEMVACSRCSYEYPEDVMQGEGGAFFCGECMTKKKSEDEDLERQRRMMSRTAIFHFKCADCKFAFKRREDFSIKICPNCSGPNFFAEGRSYK